MKSSTFILAIAAGVTAQDQSCRDGFSVGTSEVIFTVPYTYAQVMSIIGSYQNLTWSGSPEGSVSLNGSDNTVGTTRTYELAGTKVVETIREYSKPPNGPYYENHSLELLTIPGTNASVYADTDATTVTPICNGAASTFNFTARFCSTDPTVTSPALSMIHLTDAQTVGKFLGGQNYTSCSALANATATTTSGPATITTNGGNTIGLSNSAMMVVGGLLVCAGLM